MSIVVENLNIEKSFVKRFSSFMHRVFGQSLARWPKAIKQTGTKEESRLKTFLTSFGEVIEILDLRAESQRISEIVDNEKIFQGYHMNKNHWITIILNNSLPNDVLFALIDKSFDLAKK